VASARESGCERIVIAGDIESDGAITIREDPPFGGPAAGLATALPAIEDDWILLLACDLPHARLLIDLLTGAFREVGPEIDGLIALRSNHPQWLAGFYRRRSIEDALARAGDPNDISMKSLFRGLKLREVQDPEGLSRDLDTPEDLEEFAKKGEVEK
jgi:molybdopterin-guanine dinucleotide biosynthesis protein A